MAQKIEFIVTGEDKVHGARCEQRVQNALRRVPDLQATRVSAPLHTLGSSLALEGQSSGYSLEGPSLLAVK